MPKTFNWRVILTFIVMRRKRMRYQSTYAASSLYYKIRIKDTKSYPNIYIYWSEMFLNDFEKNILFRRFLITFSLQSLENYHYFKIYLNIVLISAALILGHLSDSLLNNNWKNTKSQTKILKTKMLIQKLDFDYCIFLHL